MRRGLLIALVALLVMGVWTGALATNATNKTNKTTTGTAAVDLSDEAILARFEALCRARGDVAEDVSFALVATEEGMLPSCQPLPGTNLSVFSSDGYPVVMIDVYDQSVVGLERQQMLFVDLVLALEPDTTPERAQEMCDALWGGFEEIYQGSYGARLAHKAWYYQASHYPDAPDMPVSILAMHKVVRDGEAATGLDDDEIIVSTIDYAVISDEDEPAPEAEEDELELAYQQLRALCEEAGFALIPEGDIADAQYASVTDGRPFIEGATWHVVLDEENYLDGLKIYMTAPAMEHADTIIPLFIQAILGGDHAEAEATYAEIMGAAFSSEGRTIAVWPGEYCVFSTWIEKDLHVFAMGFNGAMIDPDSL